MRSDQFFRSKENAGIEWASQSQVHRNVLEYYSFPTTPKVSITLNVPKEQKAGEVK